MKSMVELHAPPPLEPGADGVQQMAIDLSEADVIREQTLHKIAQDGLSSVGPIILGELLQICEWYGWSLSDPVDFYCVVDMWAYTQISDL